MGALVACDTKTSAPKASFANTDITGSDFGRDFSLTDHTGQRRTLADYRGKVVALFFGFAQCPDICPTTLSDLAQVKQQLGADSDKLQVLFITVDPERDTQEVLAGFVPAFDPSFVALRGNKDEIEKVTKDFKVFAQKVAGKDGGAYTIDHTAATYVYDQEGRIRLFVRHGKGVHDLLQDLKLLFT
ncbi:MAG: SCO family protein [Oxalobacteraceae bacterium]|nr:SCO family protein [Oxalobacteraceae bacterium]